MNKLRVLLACLLIVFVANIASAQTLELTIANQHVSGSTFISDLYMRATVGTVYLGGADLVLTFTSANFTSPTNTKGANATFVLNNTLGDNTTQAGGTVGAQYRSITIPAAITASEIIINLNTSGPADQPTFDSDIAKIDNSLYHFGTYTISGISNASGTMGLAWKTTGGGVTTKVYTFANTTPWAQTLLTLSTPAITNSALPVELTSLTAATQGVNNAILKWTTATEINNNGFDVERTAKGSTAWAKIGFVAGAGTSNSPKEYTYQDVNVAPGVSVYRLKQVDNGGSFKYSASVEVDAGTAAKRLELLNNYPNPFNPTTEIRFSVPEDGYATLMVYNMLGQEVATLFSGMARAGHYIPATFNAGKLASGVYISRLEYNGKSVIQRMLLTK